MGMELYRKGCKPHPFQENISLCALSVTHLRERLKEEIFEVDRTSKQLTCKLYLSEWWRKKFHIKTCFAVIWNCLQSLAPFCSLLAQSRITIYHLVLSQESKKTRFFLLLIHGRSSSRTLCSLLLRSIGVCWSLKLFLWCRNVQGLFLTPHCLHTFTLVFVHTMRLIEKYFFEIG